MTETNPPITFDDHSEIEILFQCSTDMREGFLVLAGSAGRVLEVPLSKHDAAQLIASMAAYCWGRSLGEVPAAGSA